MAKVHRGIILYSVEKNGCLNGVYANEQSPDAGVVFNEIARKIAQITPDDRYPIEGVYECSYFETKNTRRDVQLEITKRPGHLNVYDVLWIEPGKIAPIFVGVGYKMNDNQFAVHYTSN